MLGEVATKDQELLKLEVYRTVIDTLKDRGIGVKKVRGHPVYPPIPRISGGVWDLGIELKQKYTPKFHEILILTYKNGNLKCWRSSGSREKPTKKRNRNT